MRSPVPAALDGIGNPRSDSSSSYSTAPGFADQRSLDHYTNLLDNISETNREFADERIRELKAELDGITPRI